MNSSKFYKLPTQFWLLPTRFLAQEALQLVKEIHENLIDPTAEMLNTVTARGQLMKSIGFFEQPSNLAQHPWNPPAVRSSTQGDIKTLKPDKTYVAAVAGPNTAASICRTCGAYGRRKIQNRP